MPWKTPPPSSSDSGSGRWGGKTLDEVYSALKSGLKTATMSWMLVSYPDVVNATDVVTFLVREKFAKDRQEAVEIGKHMQKQELICHVWGRSSFEFRDATMYFTYTKKATTQAKDEYDMIVIGGGTAGISATSFGGSIGAKVVMVEGNRVGGDCTWSGCVPSKAMIKCAHDFASAMDAMKLSVNPGEKPKADMKKVKAYIQDKIDYIAKHDLHLLEDNNVPVRYGWANFTDQHTIELTTPEGKKELLTSKAFVLCLGAVPAPPPMKGLDKVKYQTYETIFDVDELPDRLCVIGGGVIGCELAQCFQRFGSQVSLVASRLLPKEPSKVNDNLFAQFEEEGMKILRGQGDSVEQLPDGKYKVTVKMGDGSMVTEEFDMLLVAAGRRPKTEGTGLDKAGVKLDEKTKLITVSDKLQTTCPHIFAAGDCCTLQQFTHYASQMGVWAARNIMLPGNSIPTHVVPRATFTYPEVASVGLTEAEAKEKGCEIFSQSSGQNERAVCESDLKGFIDLYVDKKTDLVVGATIMNQRAGELLAEILVCMEHKIPITKVGLRNVVHPYPTYTWATMMLATDIDSKRFQDSSAAGIVKWYIGR